MTGYGEGVAAGERCRVEVSIRCLNHRYLDLVIRLPEHLRRLEAEVAAALREQLLRGRIEVRIEVEQLGEPEIALELRRNLLRGLKTALAEAAAEGLIAADPQPADLLRVPEVLAIQRARPEWDQADTALLLEAVGRALRQADAARSLEGEKLGAVLEERLDRLESQVAELEKRRSAVAAELHEGLKARLAELLGGDQVPEERLAQEAALLVERSEVREELDRLRSHLEHFRGTLGSDGALGRRLEFLLQEMQRELNTVGSKCRDVEMGRTALEARLVCEQLREQVLNLE